MWLALLGPLQVRDGDLNLGVPAPKQRPLTQARLQALEWRFEAELQLGRHSEAVTAIEGASAEHPLRERFHVLLMLALYRCRRQADALAIYRTVRCRLIEELGVEPGPELRLIQERILRADPSLIADSTTGLDNRKNHQDQVESISPAGPAISRPRSTAPGSTSSLR
jgi:DNA-binding SARP family transcriptional activator